MFRHKYKFCVKTYFNEEAFILIRVQFSCVIINIISYVYKIQKMIAFVLVTSQILSALSYVYNVLTFFTERERESELTCDVMFS